MIAPTIAERVARGAALLDEKLPGWDKDINLDRLDLSSSCRCVVGQLFVSNRLARVARLLGETLTPYAGGLITLGLGLDGEDYDYGFDKADEAGNYELLTAEWERLILARRAGAR